MWWIRDAVLLDRGFLENKINENEFSWVSYFSLIFITLSLFFKSSVILDGDWRWKCGCFFNFRVFVMPQK